MQNITQIVANKNLLLLDMDGTILDLNFDYEFWTKYLPVRYVQITGKPFAEVGEHLKHLWQTTQGTLNWYDLNFWSSETGLDLLALHGEIAEKIRFLPRTLDALKTWRAQGKTLWLVTNSDPELLKIKLIKTNLNLYLDKIICTHDLGFAKEHPEFWRKLLMTHPFAPAQAVLIDDNLPVLRTAQEFEIAVCAITKPNSGAPAVVVADLPAVENLADLI